MTLPRPPLPSLLPLLLRFVKDAAARRQKRGPHGDLCELLYCVLPPQAPPQEHGTGREILQMEKVQCLADLDDADQVIINGPYYNRDHVHLEGMIKITVPIPKGKQVTGCPWSPSFDNGASSC